MPAALAENKKKVPERGCVVFNKKYRGSTVRSMDMDGIYDAVDHDYWPSPGMGVLDVPLAVFGLSSAVSEHYVPFGGGGGEGTLLFYPPHSQSLTRVRNNYDLIHFVHPTRLHSPYPPQGRSSQLHSNIKHNNTAGNRCARLCVVSLEGHGAFLGFHVPQLDLNRDKKNGEDSVY